MAPLQTTNTEHTAIWTIRNIFRKFETSEKYLVVIEKLFQHLYCGCKSKTAFRHNSWICKRYFSKEVVLKWFIVQLMFCKCFTRSIQTAVSLFLVLAPLPEFLGKTTVFSIFSYFNVKRNINEKKLNFKSAGSSESRFFRRL